MTINKPKHPKIIKPHRTLKGVDNIGYYNKEGWMLLYEVPARGFWILYTYLNDEVIIIESTYEIK